MFQKLYFFSHNVTYAALVLLAKQTMEEALQKQVDAGDIAARITLIHLQIEMKEDARKADAARSPSPKLLMSLPSTVPSGEPTVIERKP